MRSAGTIIFCQSNSTNDFIQKVRHLEVDVCVPFPCNFSYLWIFYFILFFFANGEISWVVIKESPPRLFETLLFPKVQGTLQCGAGYLQEL